jgi:hypothetical protein
MGRFNVNDVVVFRIVLHFRVALKWQDGEGHISGSGAVFSISSEPVLSTDQLDLFASECNCSGLDSFLDISGKPFVDRLRGFRKSSDCKGSLLLSQSR